MTDLQKLESMLRPPGKGIYTVSTGGGLASSLWKRIYKTTDTPKVLNTWREGISKIKSAKLALLGIPSDCGAGIVRGANMGPLALREYLYQERRFKKWIESRTIVDIGDIIVVPQLLHDGMLNERQISASREALYPDIATAVEEKWAVSPLSILKEVADTLFSLHPNLKILALGGDHSISWPIVESYAKRDGTNSFAILHIDAHTDCLKSRLGIDTCYGTWAYHANRLIGGNGKLVQVGIRVSSKPKSYWEEKEGVKQFWADEVLKKPTQVMEKILDHLRSLKIENIYISNDIDGTGMEFAAATGTPEKKGLTPVFVSTLIEKVGNYFNVIGADLVEVAPVLHLERKGEPAKTLKIASQYILKTIQSMFH